MRKKFREIREQYLEKRYCKKRTITLKKMCSICGIDLPDEMSDIAARTVSSFSMRSNTLEPGCVYFCPGMEFVQDNEISSIAENCICVVAAHPVKGARTIMLDSVSDVMEAIVRLFRYIKRLADVTTITVTGSIGKTSCKEMMESVLQIKYGEKMLVSIGNSNSTGKVAYNVDRLKFEHEVMLQEVGAGSGYDAIVGYSARILEPDVAVYTNIKDSHIEWYGSRENIAREKFTLSDNGSQNGLALVNYDDPILREHRFVQKKLTYALENVQADYHADDIKVTGDGTSFDIVDNVEHSRMHIALKVIGEHHILNSLTAYAVGRYMGMNPEQITRGIRKYKTKGDRQNLIDLGKYKVLADCYNSSYDAIKNILRTMSMIEVKNGRKIAVIGDIFELGDISEQTHRSVGRLLAEQQLDKVIFNGPECRYAYEEYSKIKSDSVYCASRDEMFAAVKDAVGKGDLILFKASHGMYFSDAIDTLFGTDIGEKTALGHKEYTVEEDGDYVYNVFEHNITVNGYIGSEGTIFIPSEYNGLPVEKIGKGVFRGSTSIREAVLSENIVRLRNSAFRESSLENIAFDDNLRQIAPRVFFGCRNLKKVRLPEGMLVIGYMAFAECEELREIYIPDSVQKISGKAFEGSSNVTLICRKGSYAEAYAARKGIPCMTE